MERRVTGIGWLKRLILQICSDYNGLPDVRTMTIKEIKYFYEPLIGSLAEQQRKAAKK